LVLFKTLKTISYLLAKKDSVDGEGNDMELTYSQASGVNMEDLINEYLTSDSNVRLFLLFS